MIISLDSINIDNTSETSSLTTLISSDMPTLLAYKEPTIQALWLLKTAPYMMQFIRVYQGTTESRFVGSITFDMCQLRSSYQGHMK